MVLHTYVPVSTATGEVYDRDVQAKVCPGTLLSSRRAPEAGLWTVIAMQVVQYPGPWEQFQLLLFNRSSLTSLDIEKSDFFERWDVVLTPG